MSLYDGTVFAAVANRERLAISRLAVVKTRLASGDQAELARAIDDLAAANAARASRWDEISAAMGGVVTPAKIPDELTPVAPPPIEAPQSTEAPPDGSNPLAEIEAAETACARAHAAAASVVTESSARAELAAAATAVGEALATLRASLNLSPFEWAGIPPG